MDTLKRDDLLVLLRGESLAVQASASGKGARQAAVDVDAFYVASRPEPAGRRDVLVISVYGKGIVMRP